MRQFERIESENERLQKIICNQCGKEISVVNGHETEGVFHGECVWGYFSEKDGEHHSFDLCEACYDSMAAQFCIPIEIEE